MLTVALFWEEAFPTVDALPPTLAGLRRALDGFDVRVLGADDLADLHAYDLLLMPFGSAFPKPAWPQVRIYLEAGGSLLNLGGSPFAVPCVREHVVWRREVRQAVYQRELGILGAHPVAADRIHSLMVPEEAPLLAGLRDTIRGAGAFGFTLGPPPRARSCAGSPREDCAAALLPLLCGLDAAGDQVAAPVVAIDRLRGDFAGGRWVFAAIEGEIPPEGVRRLAFLAALGAADVSVRPSRASYHAGVQPRLIVRSGHLGSLHGPHSVRVAVAHPDGTRRCCDLAPVAAGEEPAYRDVTCQADLVGEIPLAPGLYRVEAELVDEDAAALGAQLGIPGAAQPGRRTQRSGFWVRDEMLLRSGGTLARNGAYFDRGGAPCPMVGVRYVPCGGPRSLFGEPNPWLWDRDLRAARAAGINLVQVDLGPGWRALMPEPGAPDEDGLRALDAFVLTARRHDLTVLLTLFEGLPETWGGGHPYLDPRARDAQKELIAAVVTRYRDTPGVLWGLIRDPSLEAPAGDPALEVTARRAWEGWVAGRDADEVREAWRITPAEPLHLPDPEDCRCPAAPGARPMRALDYRLFAQGVFRDWASDLAIFIHLRAPGHQAVTAGSRVGSGSAPDPRFLAPYVDFAAAEMSGEGGSLLWASLIARARGKPCLLTGVTAEAEEDPDGSPRLTEAERCSLLERRLAVAFGSGCAGVVGPAWHPDPADPTGDGAAALLRADGSRTLPLAALASASGFLQRNRHRMEGMEPEPAAMVIPYSRQFGLCDLAVAATRACVETFHRDNRVPLRALSEYDLNGLGSARLILLPSPRVLRQEAWDALLRRAAEGATLVVTGPVDEDPYWRPRRRLAGLGLTVGARPVAAEESLLLGERKLWARFGGDKPRRVDKAVVSGRAAAVSVIEHGQGRVVFCPLPLELADERAPLAALYEFALSLSGLERPFLLAEPCPGILVRPVIYRQFALYAFVSETSEDQEVEALHGPQRTPLRATVPAGRAVLLFVDRGTGAEVDRCGGE